MQHAVSSFRHQITAATFVLLLDIYGSFTHMVQHLNFTTIHHMHKEYCVNVRSGKHISLTDCFIISADADFGEDKIFICFSNLWSLLSGCNFLWHSDNTFNFCTDLQSRGRTYHFWAQIIWGAFPQSLLNNNAW